MDLNITRLANIEGDKAGEFLGKIESKLIMDTKKNQIVEVNAPAGVMKFKILSITK